MKTPIIPHKPPTKVATTSPCRKNSYPIGSVKKFICIVLNAVCESSSRASHARGRRLVQQRQRSMMSRFGYENAAGIGIGHRAHFGIEGAGKNRPGEDGHRTS